MATTSINASMNVTLNPQSMNAASKEIKQALGRITGNASEFQKSLDASTARVFAFGATTLVINGVTQAFKALVASTVNVEKRLIEINSIFGGTTSEFNKFRESIFSVAQVTGQSFGTVADAASEFARQGLTAAETAKRLEAALILTRVSGLDSVKSVQALTAAINGFSSAGLTAAEITNKLVAVDTRFAVSSQDLAEGFARAGSTAEDAGVSFDELLGLITAVQQKTSRGGAVIGNALKSIFTRLSRSSTIEDLQALGVAIDASQSGVQKLQALSAALSQITDPTQASQIKELAGGVYQINVVSAALKDLSSQSSIFTQATAASAGAANDAFDKNSQLNKSIAAQLNDLIVGFTNLAEKIGQITFAPLLSSLVGITSSISEFFNKALDPEAGNTFIKALFQTIGSFIQGPGLVVITTAIFRIFKLIAGFAKDGFKAVLDIGTQAEKLKNIQAGLLDVLSHDQQFRQKMLSTTITQAEKERAITEEIARRNKLHLEEERLISNVAKMAFRAGVGNYSKSGVFTTPKGAPVLARGFVPSFSASTADTIAETSAAREHGYKAGKVFNTRLHDGTGKSFNATVNSAEKIKTVRGPNGNLGTYVIPPNGLAKGFIPNYAGLGKNPAQILKMSESALRQFMGTNTFKTTPITDPAKAAALTRQGLLSQQAQARQAARVQLKGANYGMLVPSVGFNQNLSGFQGSVDSTPYIIDNLVIRGPNPSRAGEMADPHDENLKSNIYKTILDQGARFGNSLDGSRLNRNKMAAQIRQQDGFKGINAAVGIAFEAATLAAYPEDRFSKDRTNLLNSVAGNFDLRGAGSKIQTLFGLPASAKTLDFKASADSYSRDSFISKILKDQNTSASSKARATQAANRRGFAKGFLPNFSAVTDAISREKAAGVPASSIYLDQNPSLRGSKNPYGLMVANRIDEPMGGAQGIRRAKSEGRNPRSYGAAGGYVPNFAPLRNSKEARRLKLPKDELDELQKDLQNVKKGVSGFSEVLDKYELKVKAARGSTTLLADLIAKAVNPKAAAINRATNVPVLAPQRPNSDFLTRKQQADALRAERVQGGNKRSSNFNENLEGFSNSIGKVQAALFSLSFASNTLFDSQSKLNEVIQKAIVTLSILQLLSGLGGGAIGGLKKLGKTKVGGKIGDLLKSSPASIGKKGAAQYSIGSGAKAFGGAISKKAIAARAALAAGGRFGSSALAAGSAASPFLLAGSAAFGGYKAGGAIQKRFVKVEEDFADDERMAVEKSSQGTAARTTLFRTQTAGFEGKTVKQRNKAFDDFLKRVEAEADGGKDSVQNIKGLSKKLSEAYVPNAKGEIDYKSVNIAVQELSKAIGEAKKSIGEESGARIAEKNQRLRAVSEFKESSKKLSMAIEQAASSFQVRDTALSIGAGVNVDSSSANANLIKSSIALAQGDSKTSQASNTLKGLFASSEFQALFAKSDNIDVLKNFAESNNLNQKLMQSYIKGGDVGLKERLGGVMDVSSPEGVEFFEKVKAAAESFKQNLSEAYQGAKNELAETNSQQIQLAKDLVKIAKEKVDIEQKAFDNLPTRLNELFNVGKVDPFALAKGYKDVAQEKDPLKAAEKLRGLKDQEDKFTELRGIDATRALRASQGLTIGKDRLLSEAQAGAGLDSSSIKKFFKDQFLPKEVRSAVDKGEISGKGADRLVSILEKIASQPNSEKGQEAQSLLSTLKIARQGTSDKDVDAKKALDEQMQEGVKKQTDLNNSVGILDAQIREFSKKFEGVGVIEAVNVLDASIRKASSNIDAFGSMANNLGIISQGMNDVLNDIKADIATLKGR